MVAVLFEPVTGFIDPDNQGAGILLRQCDRAFTYAAVRIQNERAAMPCHHLADLLKCAQAVVGIGSLKMAVKVPPNNLLQARVQAGLVTGDGAGIIQGCALV